MPLHIKKLNHGQSEIWIDSGTHRVIPTNEVRITVNKLAPEEDARHINASYPMVGEQATYTLTTEAEIAAALGITRG